MKPSQPFPVRLLLLLGLTAGPLLAAEPTRLPEVVSRGAAPVTSLAEEAAADETGRPDWTSHRRFSTTRVYIQRAPWEFGLGQWWRVREKDGDDTHRFQTELELGLPYRLQFDLYETWAIDAEGNAAHESVDVELRWALADWGRIPLNPTLYGEYKFVDESAGPDVYELKLLLGEEIAPRWHWGFNLVLEQETGGERTREWQATQGISYTAIDQVLGIGVEMKYVHETVAGDRDNPEHKFLVGPSVQWRPTKNTHLNLVGLFGATADSPDFEGYVIFGFDFGPGGEKHDPSYQPAAIR